jgi:ferredoxin
MIAVTVDEKACVSCTLCVEICPTDVLTFSEERDLPEVAVPEECFGCLSCSEICPAAAIDHEGAVASRCFHHDPHVLAIASRLSTNGARRLAVMTEGADLEGALDDLAVRLRSMAAVLEDILGGGVAPVGLLAGRTLATQLPRYRVPGDRGELLALTREQFAPAWDLTFAEADSGDLTIGVRDCFVREVCHREGLALGGALCVLFFNYLSGYLSKMGGLRLRLAAAERSDERCTYEVKSLI